MSQQYKIKGTDGGEYGPVSTEELQQWIAQNRCTRESLVEVDGSGEWVPLATLPGFQAAFAAPPPVPVQGDGGVSIVGLSGHGRAQGPCEGRNSRVRRGSRCALLPGG